MKAFCYFRIEPEGMMIFDNFLVSSKYDQYEVSKENEKQKESEEEKEEKEKKKKKI